MRIIKRKWIPLLAATLMIAACTPEEFNTTGIRSDEITPEYAIPLVKSDLSFEDILGIGPNNFIRADKDGLLSVVYRGTVFSSTAEQLVVFPSQKFTQSIALNAAQANGLANGQPQTIQIQSNKSFSLGSLEIDSIWLKAGGLLTSISSEIRTGGSLKVTFTDAVNAGVILSMDLPFTYGGSLPVNTSKNMSLAGYHWNMTKGINGYNDVRISFELQLNPASQVFSAGDQINIDLDLTQLKFSRYYGYIGKIDLLPEEDTIKLSIFDNNSGGQFTIDDAIIKVVNGNSFGVPVKTGLNRLATLSSTNIRTDITGFPDPLPVRVPALGQEGTMLFDSFLVNKANSNVVDEINKKPIKVIFKPYLNLNPNGKQQRNFVTDDSRFKCVVDVQLPLYGTAHDFVLDADDSSDMQMPDEDLIEEVLIRFTRSNGFPIDLTTQVYMINAANQVFDSLFNDKNFLFLKSGQVGPDGKVVSPHVQTDDIIFNQLRAKRLSDMKKFRIRASLATFNQGGTYPPVKFYKDYKLGLSIGVKAKLKVKVKEDK